MLYTCTTQSPPAHSFVDALIKPLLLMDNVLLEMSALPEEEVIY